VGAAEVDEGREEEGADEAVEEAEDDGGQDEARVEVVRLLTSSQLPDFQYFHIRLIYKCN
jgi:hypothetical protein